MKGKKGTTKAETWHCKLKVPIAVLIFVLLVITIVIVIARQFFDAANENDSDAVGTSVTVESSAISEGQETGTDNKSETALPQIRDSGALTLSSVYTSSILNPDCGNEYADEVASLEITNSSDCYLLFADLIAAMSDGTEVQFRINDLPAGATAEIFDVDNQTLKNDTTCISLVCVEEKYLDADEDELMSSTIGITADGFNTVLTNIGDSALENLTVVYHCDMAGQYFGGISYKITIENLAAGESYELADDSLMGEAAVVRVYQ